MKCARCGKEMYRSSKESIGDAPFLECIVYNAWNRKMENLCNYCVHDESEDAIQCIFPRRTKHYDSLMHTVIFEPR